MAKRKALFVLYNYGLSWGEKPTFMQHRPHPGCQQDPVWVLARLYVYQLPTEAEQSMTIPHHDRVFGYIEPIVIGGSIS